MSALLKVDPKAWFTNERTFLHWLNLAMITSVASLGAVPAVGFTMSLVSFALIGLVLYKYFKRNSELKNGIVSESKSDFLDVYTPILIAGVLTIGIVIAILIAIQEWEKSSRKFPIYTQLRWFKVGKSPRVDEIFQVPIEQFDKKGNGTVLIEWDTMQKQIEPTLVSVRGALVGETVRFRVISVYRLSQALHTVRVSVFGRIPHLIRPQRDNQPWRSSVEPDLLPAGHKESAFLTEFSCPHFDRRNDAESCSQCNVPHLHYSRQIIEKSRLLRSALKGSVDPLILSNLHVEAKSEKITRFAKKFTVSCFSLPGQPLQWGQSNAGQTSTIATPDCVKLTKASRAILVRMSQLGTSFLKKVQINSSINKEGMEEVLLTFYSERNSSLFSEIANRLVSEFSNLKGVVLNVDKKDPITLAGDSFITEYIDILDREIKVFSNSSNIDSSLLSTLIESVSDEGEKYLFGKDDSFKQIVQNYMITLSNDDLEIREDDKDIEGIALDYTDNSINEAPPGKTKPSLGGTCVISYPENEEKKGVTSKKFRHWLVNVLRPERVVIVTKEWDQLRKDIGHLKLFGYTLVKIRAIDSSPGNMDAITVLVVLEKKSAMEYEPLKPGQLVDNIN